MNPDKRPELIRPNSPKIALFSYSLELHRGCTVFYYPNPNDLNKPLYFPTFFDPPTYSELAKYIKQHKQLPWTQRIPQREDVLFLDIETPNFSNEKRAILIQQLLTSPKPTITIFHEVLNTEKTTELTNDENFTIPEELQVVAVIRGESHAGKTHLTALLSMLDPENTQVTTLDPIDKGTIEYYIRQLREGKSYDLEELRATNPVIPNASNPETILELIESVVSKTGRKRLIIDTGGFSIDERKTRELAVPDWLALGAEVVILISNSQTDVGQLLQRYEGLPPILMRNAIVLKDFRADKNPEETAQKLLESLNSKQTQESIWENRLIFAMSLMYSINENNLQDNALREIQEASIQLLKQYPSNGIILAIYSQTSRLLLKYGIEPISSL